MAKPRAKPIKILMVGSEIFPLIKTGGLADVMGALPAALSAIGLKVTTLIPGYPAVLAALPNSDVVHRYANLFAGNATLRAGRAEGLDLLVLDAPHLFARPGNPYLDPVGKDWHDNAQRFAALARVAADLGLGLVPSLTPDIIHAHDWQTGLVPVYLRYANKPTPPVVMTVHNLAYQGQFPAHLLGALGLPPDSFSMEGVEHYGAIGFLKAGLQCADAITTVSPSYAAEIATPEGGMGLDGLFRARADRVFGILNGLDTNIWDPTTDPALAAPFDAEHLDSRAANKSMLARATGLDERSDALLFGLISRFTWQKGIDLILAAIETMININGQFVVLGSGEPALEDALRAVSIAYPGTVKAIIGFDEGLAHLIQGGADALLVPSRFEPCGLTQLAAQRYGAVPIVTRVGGLADTVIDANDAALSAQVATGIQFQPASEDGLRRALHRSARLFHDKPSWQMIQRNGMRLDVSWAGPARQYAALYRSLRDVDGKSL
jgi:starch synthase